MSTEPDPLDDFAGFMLDLTSDVKKVVEPAALDSTQAAAPAAPAKKDKEEIPTATKGKRLRQFFVTEDEDETPPAKPEVKPEQK